MKPSFALDFRASSIALLHRTQRGWMQVGEAAMDAPDLNEALSYLRATALGLSPRGISTKLVIPNNQILYTTVQAAGPDGAKKRRTIKAALEGLTPYAVDDLVYDWSGSGSDIKVAVIARETLAEAEAFAVEHRFNPISFVAIPDRDTFPGEPWFGATALAPALLSDGEKVERDQEPIAIIARELPRGEAAKSPAMPDAEGPAAEPDAAPLATAVEPAAVTTPEAQVVQDVPAGPALPTSPALPAGPDVQITPATEPSAAEPLPETAYFNPLDLVEEAPMALDVPQPDVPAEVVPRGNRIDSPAPDRPSVGVLNPAIDDELPPPPSDAALMAFASRRSGDAPLTAPAPLGKPGLRGDVAPLGNAPASGLRVVADRADPERPALAKPISANDPAVQRATAAASRAGAVKSGGSAVKALRGLGGLGALVGSGTALGGNGPGKRAKLNPPAPARPAISPTTGKSLGGGMSPAPDNVSRMTPAGSDAATATTGKPLSRPGQKPLTGLGSKPLPPARPRYLGLILTGILLVLLALVAAWSTFFMASNDSAPPALESSASLSDIPAPEDEMAADLQDPAQFAAIEAVGSGDAEGLATTDAEPAVADPVAEAVPDPLADPVPPQDATARVTAETPAPETPVPDAALAAADPVADVPVVPAPEPAPATQLSTDLGATPAPATTAQDEIFLAAMDAPPQTADPGALPQVMAVTDPVPADPVPPPPFGTVYRFDADGRIVATPEGIITPEGVLLLAGKPPVLPPERPAALTVAAPVVPAPVVLAPPADAAATGATADAAAPLADDIPRGADFPSDPALAGARPLPRPTELAPPAAQADDDASAAPAADSRFASLRPLGRPAALTVASAVAASQSASLVDTSDATGGEVLLASASVNTTTSPMAVAVSRRPETRPADMSRAVEAAVAAAVAATTRQPEPQPDQTAAIQPAAIQPAAAQPAAKSSAEADSEPEVASAAPTLPTRASVAKQATYVNAINLSKMNLIGVYGTASSRYALVRQSNGRYKKVQVGDALDGGKVAAITDTELRYQKGGRMVTLELPTG